MLVAEELNADWSKVRVEPAPIDPVYNHTAIEVQATGGSTSTRSEWERLLRPEQEMEMVGHQAPDKSVCLT
jgi:CO/xanthine dehydrogenase Mo-binding subunit